MDWPIGYDDLEPYYDRVEWEMGVCGPDAPRAYDGARRRGYPMPPLRAERRAAGARAAAPGRSGSPRTRCRC